MNEDVGKEKIRQCVYCLKSLPRAKITDDHIIGTAWYPHTTPSTVQRWTAPACRECNNFYSSIEQYVHTRIAACIVPTHPAAAGMWEKAKKSFDPAQARNNRDRKHRTAQARAFFQSLMPLSGPTEGTLPFSIINFSRGSRTGFTIDGKKLNLLAEKWVRGIYYKVHGQPLSQEGSVSVAHVADGAFQAAFAGFWSERKVLDAGPGIRISYFTAEQGSKRADIYEFQVWDQFKVCGWADDLM